jgi:hypothetical protein
MPLHAHFATGIVEMRKYTEVSAQHTQTHNEHYYLFTGIYVLTNRVVNSSRLHTEQ